VQKKLVYCFILVMLLSTMGCDKPPQVGVGNQLPIYEVNIRQFSPSGKLSAVTSELPRLQKLGIKILWLMPIHPIGKVNRKGELGSYYSVQDFRAINPAYGTEGDLHEFVQLAHELGMYVILDWVANHTAWDNPLLTKHPEWYTQDSSGAIVAPNDDWTDVADLNYAAPGLRDYMSEAMLYWLREYDIDGYRCDMAEMVPLDFWQETIPRLRAEKKIFMLAESENPEVHKIGFDMTYSWEIHHYFNALAMGHRPPSLLDSLLRVDLARFPDPGGRLRFISNHDENSWQGTVFDRLGKNVSNMVTLYHVIPGTPLLYSGQEAGNRKKLPFFSHEPINWSDSSWHEVYSELLNLYNNSVTLRLGEYRLLAHDDKRGLLAFARSHEGEEIAAVFNFSGDTQKFVLPQNMPRQLRDLRLGKSITLADERPVLTLAAYSHLLLSYNK
jgi:glycosidase